MAAILSFHTKYNISSYSSRYCTLEQPQGTLTFCDSYKKHQNLIYSFFHSLKIISAAILAAFPHTPGHPVRS
jgi:hypothetical protein